MRGLPDIDWGRFVSSRSSRWPTIHWLLVAHVCRVMFCPGISGPGLLLSLSSAFVWVRRSVVAELGNASFPLTMMSESYHPPGFIGLDSGARYFSHIGEILQYSFNCIGGLVHFVASQHQPWRLGAPTSSKGSMTLTCSQNSLTRLV